MNRLKQLFSNNSEKVIPFITAGYPKKDLTVDLVIAAERGGADMIEIGMPFSDPLADGPIIQEASQTALENGVDHAWILSQVESIRKSSDIPLVLMGYYNPILQFDITKFLARSSDVGIDGIIVPDLPLEESNSFVEKCKQFQISPIMLVAPNTPNLRITQISELAGDLIYCVSILGITGSGLSDQSTLSDYLKRVKKHSKTPFIVGFGITTRKDVRFINSLADGAVVGSSLIRKIQSAEKTSETVKNYIIELKGT